MATVQSTRPITYGIGFGTRLTAVISALTGAFATWNDTRAARNALGKLSDRQLDDIGLNRGDIDKIFG